MSESTGAIILSPRQVATGDPAGRALENINTAVLGEGATCYVAGGAGQGQWQLQKEATDTADGTSVVAPISGPGRWFKRSSGGVPAGSKLTKFVTATTYQFIEGDEAFSRISFANASPVAVEVPDDSTYDFPVDTEIAVYAGGAGKVTFAGESAATIESADGFLSLRVQGSGGVLWKRGANDWVLIGDLSA